jgi:hypothetical protein
MEQPHEHPMKGQLEKNIEGYGEIKPTDMSVYLEQLDNIEEIVPDNTQPLYQKVFVQKEEDPTTKALKEKLGIK